LQELKESSLPFCPSLSYTFLTGASVSQKSKPWQTHALITSLAV